MQTEAAPAAAGQQPPPLMVSRWFDARRELVWKAWSSAEHVKAWFSPEVYTVPEATVEMRVGGPFHVCMRSPTGQDSWSLGTFTELSPYDRLVIEMKVETPDGHALFSARTEVKFIDARGGTEMEVWQTYVFADPAMAAPMVAGAKEGWRTTLDKLEREVRHIRAGEIEVHAAAKARIPEAPTHTVVHATFHLERVYDATPARVWKALSDPAAKAKWFGGQAGEFELIDRHMDVREGGSERLKGRWLKGGVTSSFEAIYHDVIPEVRLVYSYVMHLDDRKISASLATMQIKAEGAKTRLLVTEQGAFLDGYDDAGSREHGTSHLLEALGASLKD